MINPKIYATGNENVSGDFNISYYIIEKDKDFLDWLGKLLAEVLEIENGVNEAKFIIRDVEDEKGNIVNQEIYAKEINKMIDVHEHYANKGDRVDLFYGQNRVYVTFRKSRDTRKKFTEFMRKTRDWITITEVPKIPAYIGDKIIES